MKNIFATAVITLASVNPALADEWNFDKLSVGINSYLSESSSSSFMVLAEDIIDTSTEDDVLKAYFYVRPVGETDDDEPRLSFARFHQMDSGNWYLMMLNIDSPDHRRIDHYSILHLVDIE